MHSEVGFYHSGNAGYDTPADWTSPVASFKDAEVKLKGLQVERQYKRPPV
jgi:hypothetical protein